MGHTMRVRLQYETLRHPEDLSSGMRGRQRGAARDAFYHLRNLENLRNLWGTKPEKLTRPEWLKVTPDGELSCHWGIRNNRQPAKHNPGERELCRRRCRVPYSPYVLPRRRPSCARRALPTRRSGVEAPMDLLCLLRSGVMVIRGSSPEYLIEWKVHL